MNNAEELIAMKDNTSFDPLDSFDHVVVLMLENRSFDNLLGYLYDEVPPHAPLGKTFDGVIGKQLRNPVPADAVHQPPDGRTEVDLYPNRDYFAPYPDPGEEYPHVNTQLFDSIDGGDQKPYNLPPNVNSLDPGMNGFVKDYIENYKKTVKRDPTYDQYKQIMGCFVPGAVPVLSTLAKEFAVFDHWFASVPSQTWCNRAFWNAGTSWGHVNNGGDLSSRGEGENSASWLKDSIGQTIFNQIEETGISSPLNWKVYSSNTASLTGIIHALALSTYHHWPADHFPSLEQFYVDCAAGNLPSYSFLEPDFWTPHNDMHPSSYDSKHYGKGNVGSVLLGENLVAKVYNAVRTSDSASGNNAQNTLLIITFDEHGGCYDHVAPESKVATPDASRVWQDFEFKRLGVRVPMIMVSARIKKNTIVNGVKEHSSFINTMQKKWARQYPDNFNALSHRTEAAPDFTEVFTSPEPRPVSDWPAVDEHLIPPEFSEIDFSAAPLNDLQRSILHGAALIHKRNYPKEWEDPSHIETVGAAMEYLRTIPNLHGGEIGGRTPPEQGSGLIVWIKKFTQAILRVVRLK